jgi:signal peptidase II
MNLDRTPSRLCALALVASVASLVGCDHATKIAAEGALRDHASVPLVKGLVDLSYTENRDVAFDAMARLSLHPASWLLVAFGVVTTAAIVAFWSRRRRATWPEHAGFALVVAGAIGNLLDRAARGHVVDFIHVRFWPVFNVADVLVVAGVGLLVWVSARARSDAPPV